MIKHLHAILKPFILRRAKKDLEVKLPDKIEIIVNTKLSEMQQNIYIALLKQQGLEGYANKAKFNNLLMQLRKACQHPYMFDNVEDKSLPEYGEHLTDNCGKFKFLDKLLTKIFKQKEQVLLFSQFTGLLDIFEDYCIMRGYNVSFLHLKFSTAGWTGQQNWRKGSPKSKSSPRKTLLNSSSCSRRGPGVLGSTL